MNSQPLRSFRFATAAQWNACQFVQVDLQSVDKQTVIQPLSPYAQPGALISTSGAYAPVVTPEGELIWCDDLGRIHRMTSCQSDFLTFVAPETLANSVRIVSTTSGLWTINQSTQSLERFDSETLTRLLTLDLSTAPPVDIASGELGEILAISQSQDSCQVMRIDSAGHIVGRVELHGVAQIRAFVYLRRMKRFVVLAGEEHPRLYWFSDKGGAATYSLAVAGLRPCFTAHVLGSDSSDRVFLVGVDGYNHGLAPCGSSQSHVVFFDAESNRLGEFSLTDDDVPATGIVGSRDKLFVAGPRGLTRYDFSQEVPSGAGSVQCQLTTPTLFSPDREDHRRWLRIDATANLPEGTSLEVLWLATDDERVRDRIESILSDSSMFTSQRIRKLSDDPELRSSRTVFHSEANKLDWQTFSAKLFDVSERFLWVTIALTARTGAQLPTLAELNVVYPGRTLMDDLPAIYRREESQPDNYLRALVGVLETTTQGLDQRIGALGSQIHPRTAQEPWLDFIARWLGVPWDDALSFEQKRAIIKRADEIVSGRGTRRGLEALLECLLPGSPRRFRITDMTADFGLLVLGGETCAGSVLPAILGGAARCGAELNRNAVLGTTRLPCSSVSDDTNWQLVGNVKLEVAASAPERKLWETSLLALINEMVPLTVRVQLRWVATQFLRSDRLDGTQELQSIPTPHLGTDAITGQSRLPDKSSTLSATGPIMGARLN